MRSYFLAAVIAVLVCATVSAHAQIGLYAEFTGADPHQPNSPHVYGGTFGVYTTARLGPIAIGPDFRGAILHHGDVNGAFSDTSLDFGMGGFRLAITPQVIPVKPYVEILGGLAYTRSGQGSARNDSYHGAGQLIAGADYTIVPKIDWRVIEFSYGHVGTSIGAYNPATLSTGIVLRVP